MCGIKNEVHKVATPIAIHLSNLELVAIVLELIFLDLLEKMKNIAKK
jgi:hypothetical protein